MSLQHLRTFIEVFRQRSISGAARNLSLTQPAVSQHIAALESAVGRPLFERHARGVMPTAAAEDLAANLGDGLDVAEAALAAARARSTDMTGGVRIIGHGDFLAEVLAPRLLPLLREGMHIRLQTGDREEIRHNLAEGHYDLGLSAYPFEDRRLRSECVYEQAIRAVASPAVAQRIMAGPDLAEALAAEPVLAYHFERLLVDEWLAQNRLTTRPVIPALIGQDLRGLRRMLEQGFGWTALPDYLCRAQIERGDLAEIPAPVSLPINSYFIVCQPSALRHPRIAHARSSIMRELAQQQAPADHVGGDQRS
ncbi:LysR family transcriptional regulator [Novosphingobium sp. KCTC 2891]|uniref:LysR family transcriptional regulator n=1 Tax=Novosphingobium sp. KCTC 2891 TaxID=2989730 RepID=UPI002222B8C5|nr:LysR family transcriptional regulator [Novosphingobium sp. KCTC 2891]MCW1383571.1 LysR family transcriptional regulator [Novosphingobium sp. KCTC 2891]